MSQVAESKDKDHSSSSAVTTESSVGKNKATSGSSAHAAVIAVPEFFLKRVLPEECKGYLLEEEVTLLALLDKKGQLTEVSKMNDFMFLLTRIETVEGKMLYLEILQKRLTTELKDYFIQNGGYRFLRRWIQDADDHEDLFLCIKLIEVCRVLPFDLHAIKTAEIGKSIKQLTHFDSEAYTNDDHQLLKKEVSSIMKEWKAAQEVKREEERKIQEAKLAAERALRGDLDTSTTDLQVEEPAAGEQKPSTKLRTSNHGGGSAESKASTSSSSQNSDNKLKLKSEPKLVSVATLPSSTLNQQNAFNFDSVPSATTTTNTTSGATEKAGNTDINEGARKLLARKQFANPNNGIYANNAATSAPPSASSTHSATTMIVKPIGKGGLKKKDSTGASSAGGKKSIRWADEMGETLREVQYIEVEKIKSSVASYKSHKDLVKRERQLEKETYLSKTIDTMQRTTNWRKPKLLQLSVEIIDNIGEPTGSLELSIQSKRIANMLETKYLDESLIPNDPDYSAAHADWQAYLKSTGGNPREVEVISWFMEGEIDEDAVRNPPVMDVASALVGNNNIAAGIAAAPSSSSASMMYDPLISSSFNTAPAFESVDFNTRINNLPSELQKLDPITMQIILNDTSGEILSTLILPDGQVNDRNFQILQNSFSGQEYLEAVAAQQTQSTIHSLLNATLNNIPPPPLPPNLAFFNQNNLTPLSGNTLLQNLASSFPNLVNQTLATSLANTLSSNWTVNAPATTTTTNNTLSKTSFASSLLGNPTMTSSVPRSGSGGNKSSIPCKFFNSARGCLNGDKCPFGHFRENGAATSHAPTVGTPGRSGPGKGPGHRPGMRNHINNNTPDRSINKKPRLG